MAELMPADGPYVLVLTLLSIGLLLFLILVVRLHAFLALILSGMALGLAAGLDPARVLRAVQMGLGEALGFIAVVIALGAMIGRYLEYSGGGKALADSLIGKFGKENARWAVLVGAFLVGLPIFFDVGFIILAPLVWGLARESKKSLLLYGMPLASALTVTHALVPPHPAPAAAAQLLGADLGLTILYGILVSIPMVLLGGIVWGGWISKRIYVPVPAMATAGKPPEAYEEQPPAPGVLPPPGVPMVLVILLIPVALIFAATIVNMVEGPGQPIFGFFGHPFTALTVAVILAMIFLGFRRGLSRDQVSKLATDSLAPIASLLLITGGGGAFKQVIVETGVGQYAGGLLAASAISPLIVAYLIAAAMRIAQGSATVAIITAAGIVAPLVKDIPGYSPEIIVLAVCCGGAFLSHVNDSGFWIVNQYFGMTVGQTLRSWTVMKVITSLLGIAILLVVHAVMS
jgi:gluconate transporter